MASRYSYPLYIGLRYSFSRKRTRFASLVALASMLGMVLGVASLITVLSVMNGFSTELRDRILSLVPHATIMLPGRDAAAVAAASEIVSRHPRVTGVAPFMRQQVLLGSYRQTRGARLVAIDPALEPQVSRIPEALIAGRLADLDAEPFGVVLGVSLARSLGIGLGDAVSVTVPHLTVTPLGVFPRSRSLTVVGLFEVGAEADASQAFISLDSGRRLFGPSERIGLRVATADLFAAPAILNELRKDLPEGLVYSDWSQTQGSLFRAVRMEKLTVSLLLLSVVAVAAFNIVSTLVMSVSEKRGEIAVLRTLGVPPGGITKIFLIYGMALAVLGVAVGAVLGVLLSLGIADIVHWVESLVGANLFDPTVYFISALPSVLKPVDVLAVVTASLFLGLIATIYPARRAAAIPPAEVLRYE